MKIEARKRKPPVCEKALTYASGKEQFLLTGQWQHWRRGRELKKARAKHTLPTQPFKR